MKSTRQSVIPESLNLINGRLITNEHCNFSKSILYYAVDYISNPSCVRKMILIVTGHHNIVKYKHFFSKMQWKCKIIFYKTCNDNITDIYKNSENYIVIISLKDLFRIFRLLDYDCLKKSRFNIQFDNNWKCNCSLYDDHCPTIDALLESNHHWPLQTSKNLHLIYAIAWDEIFFDLDETVTIINLNLEHEASFYMLYGKFKWIFKYHKFTNDNFFINKILGFNQYLSFNPNLLSWFYSEARRNGSSCSLFIRLLDNEIVKCEHKIHLKCDLKDVVANLKIHTITCTLSKRARRVYHNLLFLLHNNLNNKNLTTVGQILNSHYLCYMYDTILSMSTQCKSNLQMIVQLQKIFGNVEFHNKEQCDDLKLNQVVKIITRDNSTIINTVLNSNKLTLEDYQMIKNKFNTPITSKNIILIYGGVDDNGIIPMKELTYSKKYIEKRVNLAHCSSIKSSISKNENFHYNVMTSSWLYFKKYVTAENSECIDKIIFMTPIWTNEYLFLALKHIFSIYHNNLEIYQLHYRNTVDSLNIKSFNLFDPKFTNDICEIPREYVFAQINKTNYLCSGLLYLNNPIIHKLISINCKSVKRKKQNAINKIYNKMARGGL